MFFSWVEAIMMIYMERVETAYMHTESMSVCAQRQIYRNVTCRVYVYKNKRDCVYPQKKPKKQEPDILLS